MKRAVTIAASLIWLTACPGPSDGDDGPAQTQKCSATPEVATGDAKVLLGTGATAFTPLANGAELMLEHGPQGGTHIYLDVLFQATAAGPRTLSATFTPTEGLEQSQQSTVQGCAGWNRVQNLRFVLYASGPGKLKVAVAGGETPEIDVTLR